MTISELRLTQTSLIQAFQKKIGISENHMKEILVYDRSGC